MNHERVKVLFLCTHNRCRSILCEAIAQHIAGDVIEAKSAGSQAVDAVHPLTLRHLSQAGIATDGLRSQSWDEMASFAPDVVITVCHSAAQETCPAYIGSALKLHWPLADPSALAPSQQEAAFHNAIKTINQLIQQLVAVVSKPHQDDAQWRLALQAITPDNAPQ